MGSGHKRLLIDAGQGEPEYLANLRRVVSEGVSQGGFEAIILTHSHIDHIGGVADILQAWGPIPILKFKEAEEPADLKPLIRHITDGEVIRTEGATLRAIHTPG